jgi:hypothetical protein
MMDAAVRIVGCPDRYRIATRQESIWVLVGGGWRSHGALAFYLGLDCRSVGSEDSLVQGIANVVAEAATLGHCLDPEEIAEALREYRQARGLPRPRRPEPDYEPETAA